MARRKPAAAAEPAAPKRTRSHVTPKQRALTALAVIDRAIVGDPDAQHLAAGLRVELEGLDDDWSPTRPPSGPLRAGDYAEPLPKVAGTPAHEPLTAPYRIRTIYADGRSQRCVVVDAAGVVGTGMLLSDLRRAAAPPADGAVAG